MCRMRCVRAKHKLTQEMVHSVALQTRYKALEPECKAMKIRDIKSVNGEPQTNTKLVRTRKANKNALLHVEQCVKSG